MRVKGSTVEQEQIEMMRFSTTAPAHMLRVIGQVCHTLRNIEEAGGLTTFTVGDDDAMALIQTLRDSKFQIHAGGPKIFGIAPEPRGIPATSATVKR